MKHIAVQQGLTPIRDYLSDHGYKVSEISAGQKDNKDFTDGFDAVVLTGIDTNFMGFHNTKTKARVINADGLKPEEVANAIEGRPLQ